MNQRLINIALLVGDYDEAIAFYCNKMNFQLVEDTLLSPNKRWVVVAPPGNGECTLLLAKANGPRQEEAIGNQSGGRVFLFLFTDDIARDVQYYKSVGVGFAREMSKESYGKVAVIEDLYGNLWDIIEPGAPNKTHIRLTKMRPDK